MRLRFLPAVTVFFACLPCFATPVSIGPGQTVTPGSGTYGGTIVDQVSDNNKKDTINYTDTVYADPNNPLCAGCYEFVLQLTSVDGSRVPISVTTAPFQGDKYELEVAYEDDGMGMPTTAEEGSGGSKITFGFTFPYDLETDPLIIYTNAMGDKSGNLTIKTAFGETDPPAFAPAGRPVVATTPEPSSLLLLGTGALGMLGTLRRRFRQS